MTTATLSPKTRTALAPVRTQTARRPRTPSGLAPLTTITASVLAVVAAVALSVGLGAAGWVLPVVVMFLGLGWLVSLIYRMTDDPQEDD